MDGIDLELFLHRLTSVAEEMGEVLRLTAFSPNIKERLDHSCAVLDARGAMVAQAAHIPVHLGAIPLCVRAVLERLELADGDVAIVNDPFAGGTHLPDITLVRAVDVGGHRFHVVARAHHADVGGITPGSLPPSRTIDDEGWRIEPTLLTDAVIASLMRASRTPDERRGDFAAQVAACGLGARRLVELGERYGADRVAEAAVALQDYTERRIDALLATLPEATVHARDVLDGTFLSDEPIPIVLALTHAGGRLTFDFTGSADQVEGPMNAVRAIVESAVFYALLCLLDDDVPANSGLMRRVDVLTRPGSVVDALPPAAVAAGNVETSQRVVDVVMQGLAQLCPGRLPACSCGSMNNVLLGSLPDRAPAWVTYETVAGGAGAGPRGDGASAVQTHMTNTLNTPVEAFEHAFPVRMERCGVREGSGGAGRHRGGDGVVRAWRFLEPCTMTLIGERRTSGPPGAAGGAAGEPGVAWLERATGERRRLPGKVSLDVQAGDLLVLETPGGGGYGPPPDPEPEP